MTDTLYLARGGYTRVCIWNASTYTWFIHWFGWMGFELNIYLIMACWQFAHDLNNPLSHTDTDWIVSISFLWPLWWAPVTAALSIIFLSLLYDQTWVWILGLWTSEHQTLDLIRQHSQEVCLWPVKWFPEHMMACIISELLALAGRISTWVFRTLADPYKYC